MSNSHNHDSNGTEFITAILGALVCLLAWIFWIYFGHILVKIALIAARHSYELIMSIEPFVPWNQYARKVFYFLFPEYLFLSEEIIRDSLQFIDPKQATFSEFLGLTQITGYVYRPFFALALMLMALYVFKRSEVARNYRNLNTFSLMKIMKDYYPHLRPVVMEDLYKSNADHGPWRQNYSPIRWAIKNNVMSTYGRSFRKDIVQLEGDLKLLTFNDNIKGDNVINVKDDVDTYKKYHQCMVINHDRLRNVLIKQLGGYWEGYKSLTDDFEKAMFAVSIALCCGNRDESLRLLRQFNESWTPPKYNKKGVVITPASINMKGVDESIEKYINNPHFTELEEKHAYKSTLLTGVFTRGKSKGAIKPTLYTWFYRERKQQYYEYDQVGGWVAYTEACAVRAHYLAEEEAGLAVYTPQIDEAVKGIEFILGDILGWTATQKDLSVYETSMNGDLI